MGKNTRYNKVSVMKHTGNFFLSLCGYSQSVHTRVNFQMDFERPAGRKHGCAFYPGLGIQLFAVADAIAAPAAKWTLSFFP